MAVREDNEVIVLLRVTVMARLALTKQHTKVMRALEVSYFLKYFLSRQPSIMVLVGYSQFLLSLYV